MHACRSTLEDPTESGNLTIDTGTAVYLLDDAVIDLAAGVYDSTANGVFTVKGLLRVLAGETHHATITSHKAGGLAAGEGITMVFDHAPSYVPADGSGTLVQNTEISNLRSGNLGYYYVVELTGSAPAFLNSKLIVNAPSDWTILAVRGGSIFSHCLIDGLQPAVVGDLSATTFAIQHSVLRARTSGNYTLDFASAALPIADGQIAWNDIDGTQPLDVAFLDAGTIPLGNNYWRNRVPSVRYQGAGPTASVSFTPVLSDPPAGVGPSW